MAPQCGEVGLISQQPRAADVVAMRDTSVAFLTHQQFEALLIHYPVKLNRTVAKTIFEHSNQSTNRPLKLAQQPPQSYRWMGGETAEICIGMTEVFAKTGRTSFYTCSRGTIPFRKRSFSSVK